MPEKKTSSMAEQIYHELRKEIAQGKRRAGDRLKETEIAEKMGVSRSPVREALRLMVNDGLAVGEANKGIFVRTISDRDMAELFELRLLVDRFAIQKAANTLTEEKRQELKQCRAEILEASFNNDYRAYMRADNQLHLTVASLADNHMLLEDYQRHRYIFLPARILSQSTAESARVAVSEHIALIDALLEGEFEEALAIDEHHLRRSLGIIQNTLNRRKED